MDEIERVIEQRARGERRELEAYWALRAIMHALDSGEVSFVPTSVTVGERCIYFNAEGHALFLAERRRVVAVANVPQEDAIPLCEHVNWALCHRNEYRTRLYLLMVEGGLLMEALEDQRR
jgi:hypothetical protein